jgi:hypothetical protein
VGKATPDAILDAMADAIILAVTGSPNGRLFVCSGEPANAAGIAAVDLAEVYIDNTDFSKANGDSSGRKVTVAQQSNISIHTSGTASHIVLASASTLLYVTTCTSQALTAGGTVTVPAWDIEVADPV